MSILAKVVSLFHVDVSKLKQVHLFSDNSNTKKFYIDNRTININVGQVEDKKRSLLKNEIKEAVVKEGELLLEDNAKEVLEDFASVDEESKNKKELEYFRGKIPNEDLVILRASLYVKTAFKKGRPVRDLKWDIIQRYGTRGKNIVNLCSAGYFQTMIRPLYEEMSKQPDFTQEKFLLIYDKIINQITFAVFVNSQMSPKAIKLEIEEKMAINKNYGITHLNIHGIGSDNVDKILEVLAILKEKFSAQPEIDSGATFITVKIWF